MADRSAPEQLEAQLRTDLARYPNSSALQMALGNLYASQNRWAEAQKAFFEVPSITRSIAVRTPQVS